MQVHKNSMSLLTSFPSLGEEDDQRPGAFCILIFLVEPLMRKHDLFRILFLLPQIFVFLSSHQTLVSSLQLS
jgi:hypothetical protein